MPYHVYILKCQNGSLYTGITTDLQRRFAEHKSGKGGHYTSSNPPVKILYSEKHKNRSKATKREIEIKGWTREKKMALILFLTRAISISERIFLSTYFR